MTLDSDLENLFIVGSVGPGRRLRHSNGKLCVDEHGVLSGTIRRLMCEGRERTIFSIRQLLQSAGERVALMGESRLLDAKGSTSEHVRMHQRLTMLDRALRHCSRGIDGLKATYAADASAQAALDLTQQVCQGLIEKVSGLLPAENLPACK